MPGTSAKPLGRAGADLSSESLAHELKTPLAAIEASGATLLVQLGRLLEALGRIEDPEALRRLLPLITSSFSAPAPPPPLGSEMLSRIASAEGRLRESGTSLDAGRSARRLVQSGWDLRIGEIAPLLAHRSAGDLLDVVEASGRIRTSLSSLGVSAGRIGGIVLALKALGDSAGQAPGGRGARACLESAVLLLRHRIPEGVEIDIAAGEESAPLRDPVRAEQIVTNLLANALDAVPARGGRIALSCETTGESHRIRVEDHGPGIPPAMRGRLFTPFSTSRASGTGLGLFLARRMAEELGGSLTLEEGSPGAAFLLVLPGARGEGA